jgi:hypothetical protein
MLVKGGHGVVTRSHSAGARKVRRELRPGVGIAPVVMGYFNLQVD